MVDTYPARYDDAEKSLLDRFFGEPIHRRPVYQEIPAELITAKNDGTLVAVIKLNSAASFAPIRNDLIGKPGLSVYAVYQSSRQKFGLSAAQLPANIPYFNFPLTLNGCILAVAVNGDGDSARASRVISDLAKSTATPITVLRKGPNFQTR